MEAFADGRLKILVATTVIEVGVNVPNATLMVIEHAERFGLAQLHQLRGRVGRGDRQSYLHAALQGAARRDGAGAAGDDGETEDGFLIAEKDLELRGGGEVMGARQSGTPGFRVARIEVHGKFLRAAREDAMLVLGRDPRLASARGAALRQLLYLLRATRRSDCWARVDSPSARQRIGANLFEPSVPLVQNQISQHDEADDGNKGQQQPPAGAVHIMQPAGRHSDARQEYSERENGGCHRHSDHSVVDDLRHHLGENVEQHPVPIFGPAARLEKLT